MDRRLFLSLLPSSFLSFPTLVIVGCFSGIALPLSPEFSLFRAASSSRLLDQLLVVPLRIVSPTASGETSPVTLSLRFLLLPPSRQISPSIRYRASTRLYRITCTAPPSRLLSSPFNLTSLHSPLCWYFLSPSGGLFSDCFTSFPGCLATGLSWHHLCVGCTPVAFSPSLRRVSLPSRTTYIWRRIVRLVTSSPPSAVFFS